MTVAVFYHLYQCNNWEEIFHEQSNLLIDSGLADFASFIHVGVNGINPIKLPHNKFVAVYNPQPFSEETPTLISLRDFCFLNSGWKILYMHAKGITQPSKATYDWRKTMEYFCVEKWENSIQKLDLYDAVGCLYMDHCYYGYFPHFSGNFWWARSDYIKRLDHSYLSGGIRQNREFWIGTGHGSMYSFHTTNLNHYAHQYPRDMYVNGQTQ